MRQNNLALSVNTGVITSLRFAQFMQDFAGCWDGFLESADNRSPMLDIDWLDAWWRHFGRDGAEQILIYGSAADPHGALFTATVPETRYGVTYRALQLWVNSHSQRAPLLVVRDPEGFAQALVEFWRAQRNQWDIARLQGIPAGPFAQALLNAAAAAGLRPTIERVWSNHRVAIDRPWDEYYRSLSRNAREKGERLERRLTEQGKCERRVFSGEEVPAAFEQYLAIEQRSWKATTGEVILQKPALAGFYRDAIVALARRGRASIDLLSLDGYPICGLVSLVYRRRVFVCKTSYDEAYQKYSPGWLVYRDLMREAFAQRFDEIDLFGNTRFTSSWSEDQREFQDFTLLSPTLRGRFAGVSRHMKNKIQEMMK